MTIEIVKAELVPETITGYDKDIWNKSRVV